MEKRERGRRAVLSPKKRGIEEGRDEPYRKQEH